MKGTTGRAVVLLLTAGLALALTACTDNSGAIDQLGHNGWDRMACNDFNTLATQVKYGVVGPDQARSAADKLLDTSQRGGDPRVRQAGAALADAYRTESNEALNQAITDFQAACRW